jgi:precorrin-3B synthase
VSPALDACPGVLTLHPARDGLVARIRLPGGYASGARWRALARLSGEFGDGCVDVTARGNVQLRGLRAADAEALAAGAAEAGLMPSAQHDRARNITASPLSGLGGRPALRDLVDALDAALLAGPEFAALPGRFLFALDDGTAGASLASSDLGLSYTRLAPAAPGDAASLDAPPDGPASDGASSGGAPSGGAATASASSGGAASGGAASGGAASPDAALDRAAEGCFDLFVAGRRTGVRVPAAEAVPAILAATRAALAAGVGASVTRIAALPDAGQSVAAAAGGTLGAPAPPDTRLPLGPAPAASATAAALPTSSAASPTRHTDPADLSRHAPVGRPRPPRAELHDRDRFTAGSCGESVTIMEESGGADRAGGRGGASEAGGVVVVAARLGRLSGEQVEVIAGLVAPEEVVRVGIAGRLVIPLSAGPTFGPAGLSGGGAALARLAAAGLIVAADDPMGDVTACSGAACDRSLADVRGAARPVSNYRKTHWAGCSRRCGCPPDAEPVVALDATRYRMPGEGAA